MTIPGTEIMTVRELRAAVRTSRRCFARVTFGPEDRYVQIKKTDAKQLVLDLADTKHVAETDMGNFAVVTGDSLYFW